MTDDILSTSIFALIIAVAIPTLIDLVDTDERLETAVTAAASAAQVGYAVRTVVASRHGDTPANARASREAS